MGLHSKPSSEPGTRSFQRIGDQATDRDTIVFLLKASCTSKLVPSKLRAGAPKTGSASAAAPALSDPNDLYNDHTVYSSHLTWNPQGEQAHVLDYRPPAPLNGNIELVKMRPGQEVDLE